MAKSPQPAATKQPEASRCESLRKVPDTLCGGEVRLYNLKKHPLPEVVNTPPEKEAAECEWWMVHFPSRKCCAVPGGRSEGLRLLKKLEQGKDELGWLPEKAVKKTRARGRVGAREGKDAGGGLEEKLKLTKIPPGLSFDAAMKHAFPNERIVHEIERMLQAEDEVVMAGKVLGSKPNWSARKDGLKLMIEHAQGRAGEKPAPQPDKKKVSYDELEQMIVGSEAARMYFKRLIEKVEAVPAVAGPVLPPAEVKG